MVSDNNYFALSTSSSLLKINLLCVSQEQSLFSADFNPLSEQKCLHHSVGS